VGAPPTRVRFLAGTTRVSHLWIFLRFVSCRSWIFVWRHNGTTTCLSSTRSVRLRWSPEGCEMCIGCNVFKSPGRTWSTWDRPGRLITINRD
jgi:hypothetical protein